MSRRDYLKNIKSLTDQYILIKNNNFHYQSNLWTPNKMPVLFRNGITLQRRHGCGGKSLEVMICAG